MEIRYSEGLLEAYEHRTPGSAKLNEQARQLLPSGVGSNIRYYEPYPLAIKKAQGSRVWDVDGNEYVDFSMNMGAQLVGHAHPKIVQAISRQAAQGTLFTMPHPLEREVAIQINHRFPVIEQVRFTNSGTEATMHAMRLARGYTGQDKIIKIEGCYHGAHDDVLISVKPEHIGRSGHPRYPTTVFSSRGIPDSKFEEILVAPFNDLQAIRGLLEENFNDIAAIILEPVMMNAKIILPEAGYLQGLRDLATEYNTVLIFDEVKTGCKIAPGGACEYFGVQPDLVCLAKAIGGGLPLGAFGGRADIMAEIAEGRVLHAGTYNTNPLVMKASLVTLRDLLTDDTYDEVKKLSDRLTRGYRRLMSRHKIPGHVVDISPCGAVFFTTQPVKNWRELLLHEEETLWHNYWFGMVNHGIIPQPFGFEEQWTISIQHTKEDIDQHLEAFETIAPMLGELAQELEVEESEHVHAHHSL